VYVQSSLPFLRDMTQKCAQKIGKISNAENFETFILGINYENSMQWNSILLERNVDPYLTMKDNHDIVRKRVQNSKHGMTPFCKSYLYMKKIQNYSQYYLHTTITFLLKQFCICRFSTKSMFSQYIVWKKTFMWEKCNITN
jgi:hypothetical protein